MTHEGLKALLDGVKDHKLTSLNIGWSRGLESNSGKLIAELIQTSKTLTHLNLSCNNSKEAEIKLILEAVKIDNSVLHLVLCGNNIGTTGYI
ncbi:leucine-rich repeat domain-containing protein [Rickettsia bellii]|nr:hypothetical protein [Rickettsia bellii]KJV89486.1 putative leucine-rich repeat protein [Rickettsia bellii str. RML An4]